MRTWTRDQILALDFKNVSRSLESTKNITWFWNLGGFYLRWTENQNNNQNKNVQPQILHPEALPPLQVDREETDGGEHQAALSSRGQKSQGAQNPESETRNLNPETGYPKFETFAGFGSRD